MKTAVYPGSFDPVTHGHMDLIKRGNALFSKLIVAVAHNSQKTPLFSVEERVEMIRELTKDLENVSVESFEGMSVDFARQCGAEVLFRGTRTPTDFEYEFQMALTNRAFAPEIETVFIMSHYKYLFMSSKLIKEAIMLKQESDISAFVPPLVEKRLKQRIRELHSKSAKE